MEKDTVVLSLKECNELRDFKEAISEGKVVVHKNYEFSGYYETLYMDKHRKWRKGK